jgi:hypothetical protein
VRIHPLLLVAAATAASGFALMGSPGGEGGAEAALAGASGYARVSTDDCNDWNASSIDRRLRLIDEMGDHFGHPSAIWSGAKLPDGEARRVIQQACDAQQASDIKLYKIYSRALTFRAYAEQRGS